MKQNGVYIISIAAVCLSVCAVIIACGGGGSSDMPYHPVQPTSITSTSPQPSVGAGDSKPAFDSFVADLKSGNTTNIQSKIDPTAWNAGLNSIVTSSTNLKLLGELFDGATLETETDEAAYYIARRTENGVPVTYYIQMVKVDGIWKVASF